MNQACRTIARGMIFSLALASIPAIAVRLVPSSTSENSKGAASGALLPIASSGVIASIDIARQSINVGSSTFMFVPSLTKVYSADPLINGNPLRLKVGQTIDFTVITDASGKQRITDIAVKKW